MNNSERKDLYPHLTPSRLTLTKYIGDVTEIRGPKILTAYLAHRRPIRSVKKEMRNRRTFCQRMGRSKTHLVDLCSPSTPLFVMLILEEVGSVVEIQAYLCIRGEKVTIVRHGVEASPRMRQVRFQGQSSGNQS